MKKKNISGNHISWNIFLQFKPKHEKLLSAYYMSHSFLNIPLSQNLFGLNL